MKPIFLLIPALAAAPGLALLVVGLAGLAATSSTSDWVEVPAKVERFEEQHGRRQAGNYRKGEIDAVQLKVWYSYDVDGKRYESHRYSLDEEWDEYAGGDDFTQEHLTARRREIGGGTVTAFYDPDDPASAVLQKPERLPAIVVTVAGSVFLLGALVMAGVMLLSLRRRRDPVAT